MHWDSMAQIARLPTYSWEAIAESSLGELTPPQFSGISRFLAAPLGERRRSHNGDCTGKE